MEAMQEWANRFCKVWVGEIHELSWSYITIAHINGIIGTQIYSVKVEGQVQNMI